MKANSLIDRAAHTLAQKTGPPSTPAPEQPAAQTVAPEAVADAQQAYAAYQQQVSIEGGLKERGGRRRNTRFCACVRIGVFARARWRRMLVAVRRAAHPPRPVN